MMNKYKSILTGLLCVTAGTAMATMYDFSDGSYTNGPLNGQNEWISDADLTITAGELVMATTNDWETATRAVENTNTHYTVSSWFSFYQTGPKGTGQEVQRIILNDATGGGSPISAILRRAAADVYVLQTKTDQAGAAANQGWQTFNSALLGLSAGDAAGSSDDLYLSVTFVKGLTADTWSSHVVLSNLTTGAEIRKDDRIDVFDVTTNMHNAATYYGGVNGSQADVKAGVSDRIVTQLEVAAIYIERPTFDTVFQYDMSHLNDSQPFSNTSGWDSLNQWGWGFINTNETAGSRLVHRPASVEPEFETNKKGWNWRGVMYTNGLPRTVEAGETIEFAVDYTMFAHTAVSKRNGIDFFFTTNGVAVGENTSAAYEPSAQYFGKPADVSGQMGFRVRQYDWTGANVWPDGGLAICMDPSNPGSPNGSVNLNDIGVTNLLGGVNADIQSDPVTLTFTALKTTNSGIWNLTVTVQDELGETLTTVNEASWTNQAIYDATDIYFGMYSYNATADEEGTELDNMHCRIKYVDNSALPLWEQYEIAYELTGGTDGDDDTDGENNWYEYVLGGDPTNAAVLAVQPVLDAGASEYVFSLRGDSLLKYSIIATDNLIYGTWVTNAPTAAPSNNGEIHVINEAVETSEDTKFLKLLVE